MSAALIDTHAHLDQDEFAGDLEQVVEHAVAAGVERIIAVGTTLDSSRRSIEIARRFAPTVRAAVGIQPNYVAQTAHGDWDEIVALAGEDEVVAIGETGLDRYWDYAPFELQQDYFDRHLRLAQKRGLPFIVHTRDSDADVVAMLREARAQGELHGVMHSFTGTAATAAECIELGMHISFAGMVTFKKSAELRQVAASVPLARLLVETDSPYLSPEPRRGRRNEPAHVVYTAACIAAARGIALDDLAAATTENARRLFSL